MVVEVTFTAGGAARTITFEPQKLSLGFLMDIEEAQETNKYRPLITAFNTVFRLTLADLRAMTVEEFGDACAAVQEAMKQANAIPNG